MDQSGKLTLVKKTTNHTQNPNPNATSADQAGLLSMFMVRTIFILRLSIIFIRKKKTKKKQRMESHGGER